MVHRNLSLTLNISTEDLSAWNLNRYLTRHEKSFRLAEPLEPLVRRAPRASVLFYKLFSHELHFVVPFQDLHITHFPSPMTQAIKIAPSVAASKPSPRALTDLLVAMRPTSKDSHPNDGSQCFSNLFHFLSIGEATLCSTAGTSPNRVGSSTSTGSARLASEATAMMSVPPCFLGRSQMAKSLQGESPPETAHKYRHHGSNVFEVRR